MTTPHNIALAALLLMPVAGSNGSEKPSAAKPQRSLSASGAPQSSLMNINDISMWANSNGQMERSPQNLSAGVVYPPGTASAVYQGGFLWTGFVHDQSAPILRTGGQTATSGTIPGRIVRPGVSENPHNADVRIYRIRRDWATADLRRDASELFGVPSPLVTSLQIQSVRDQYRTDWIEWPWQQGAPYYDRDGQPGYQPASDGAYDSTKDEPGIAGADQVMWFVANDLDGTATRGLYGSPPIGLEMQVTCWAFSHAPKLRQTIYERYRVIYKGTATTPPNATIDSMYFAKWVDPDLGEFSDDFVGYVPENGMGYAYNSKPVDPKFANFNLTPPVIGYDMLQGPRVAQPGSSAHFDLHTREGFRNLPVSVFTYFTVNSRVNDLQTGNYAGTLGWWNLVHGYYAAPVPLVPPHCFVDPTTGQCTPFELSGDPGTFRGWVDGRNDPPGDRRFAISAGPCAMAFGDTQEVVVALMAAMGTDNKNGIPRLIETDGESSDPFNLNFELPDPVPVPPLRIVELDDKLILDWEKDTLLAHAIESYHSRGYHFETYNIYQFPNSTAGVADAKTLPTFDPGTPKFLTVTNDLFRNQPLVNGQRYYFAVTAVMVNPDPELFHNRLESPISLQTGTPHSPNPGTVYPYQIDEITPGVSNLIGINDANVRLSYFDPTRPDGHIYKFLFHRFREPEQDNINKPRWDLIDSTTNDTLLSHILTDSPAQRVITRGFSVAVTLPPSAMRGVYQISSGNQQERVPVFNRPDPAGKYMVVSTGTSQLDSLSGGIDLDTELRFNGDSSWSVFIGDFPSTSRWVKVPYTAWQVTVNGGDTTYRQLYTAVTSQGTDTVWRPSELLDQAYNNKTLKVFYPVTVFVDSLYSIFYAPYPHLDTAWLGGTYHDDIPTRAEGPITKANFWTIAKRERGLYSAVWKAYIADLDEDGIAAPRGTTIRFERYKLVRDGDQKLFRPVAVTMTNFPAAVREVERVNVFPNPYYGMNRAEETRSQRFVTFSHLPWHATIRLFNLAGVLVKTIRKDDDSQFTRWDLNNENGLPAASGLYLAHLQLSDAKGISLGEKTLKLMLVREEQLFNEN